MDRLPINNASAHNIPDPQADEPAVHHECAYCGAEMYSGDEVIRDPLGYFFCNTDCYCDWQRRLGEIDRVVLTADGDYILQVMR